MLDEKCRGNKVKLFYNIVYENQDRIVDEMSGVDKAAEDGGRQIKCRKVIQVDWKK